MRRGRRCVRPECPLGTSTSNRSRSRQPMKRVLFSITGTVAGVVALLGYKSHGHAIGASGPLPSAGLSTTSAAPPAGSSTESIGTGSATPRRSSTGPSVNTPTTATGDAVETRYGIVQVKVTVGSGRIQNVQFVQLTAFDQRSAEINNAAAPLLL